jgi:hypothetical protein
MLQIFQIIFSMWDAEICVIGSTKHKTFKELSAYGFQ